METATKLAGDVKDITLAEKGKRKIEWANQQMPVLQLIRKQFIKDQPLKGIRMSACLHVTSETGNLAVTLRDRGDLRGAELVLEGTLALCDQAGLVPQALQTHAAVALVCTLDGRPDAARRAAHQALVLSEQVHDPVNEAVALEAQGIVAEPAAGVQALRRAQAGWESLERPLDAARCLTLIGRRLHESDQQAGDEALGRAATLFDELGVSHLAERSRELALA